MSSPNANTKLDPSVAGRVATDHRETAVDVGLEVQHFDEAVAVMDEHCDGAMMRALLSARDSWVSELKLIIADLNTMAGNVDGTIQDFDQQDYDNAGQIGTVGVSILKDI
ncbi:hypothetical protein [Actinoplanes derwentensis]|uniref:Uncharacterized protein n=1 Tax=Actinoplanes derwentensis TaxID=113562 RepID=A0A1H2C8R0_9ACTN|nr:hypothetical protein [Actinoplanes derwentensis]GID86549.1 hypothetical protein Ade03nite_54730 [Actinoplanes derwentensis]SDT66456.1 hypothetical protein SAMN04489716_5352 [Actinoplanes derwentensis]